MFQPQILSFVTNNYHLEIHTLLYTLYIYKRQANKNKHKDIRHINSLPFHSISFPIYKNFPRQRGAFFWEGGGREKGEKTGSIAFLGWGKNIYKESGCKIQPLSCVVFILINQ